jgi:rod shape-determining protein MreD
MIWLISLPMLVLIAILQSSLLSQLRFLDGGIDLALVMIICWSLLRPDEGLAWGAIVGALCDFLSGGPFGTTSIAFVLAALLAGQLHGRLWITSPLAIMAVTLIGTILSETILILFLVAFNYSLDIPYAILYIALPTTFLNMVVSVPIYLSLYRLHKWTMPPKLAVEEEE